MANRNPHEFDTVDQSLTFIFTPEGFGTTQEYTMNVYSQDGIVDTVAGETPLNWSNFKSIAADKVDAYLAENHPTQQRDTGQTSKPAEPAKLFFYLEREDGSFIGHRTEQITAEKVDDLGYPVDDQGYRFFIDELFPDELLQDGEREADDPDPIHILDNRVRVSWGCNASKEMIEKAAAEKAEAEHTARKEARRHESGYTFDDPVVTCGSRPEVAVEHSLSILNAEDEQVAEEMMYGSYETPDHKEQAAARTFQKWLLATGIIPNPEIVKRQQLLAASETGTFLEIDRHSDEVTRHSRADCNRVYRYTEADTGSDSYELEDETGFKYTVQIDTCLACSGDGDAAVDCIDDEAF